MGQFLFRIGVVLCFCLLEGICPVGPERTWVIFAQEQESSQEKETETQKKEKHEPEKGYIEEPPYRPLSPPRASKSVEIGTFYLKKGEHKAALSRFQEAVRTDPFYAPAYKMLGKVYEKLGKKEEALRAYKKYLAVLPSGREAGKATDVHKAIARLERELGSGKKK